MNNYFNYLNENNKRKNQEGLEGEKREVEKYTKNKLLSTLWVKCVCVCVYMTNVWETKQKQKKESRLNGSNWYVTEYKMCKVHKIPYSYLY